MAKEKDKNAVHDEIVEHNEDFVGGVDQNEALLRYKVTGVVGAYADPTRDQEPDIAPLLGEAPHPEMGNPPPAPESFSGQALSVDQNPVLASSKDREKDAEEATKAFNEAVQAREEFVKSQSGNDSSAALPVYVVDSPEDADATEGSSSLPADESKKSRDGNPEAKS